MDPWQNELKVDPVPILLSSGNEAIKYFTLHDLCDRRVESVEILWVLPAVKKIIKKQQNDSSWKYPHGTKAVDQVDYDQYQTYLILAELVEKYGLTKEHKSIEKAAEFLFHLQTEEGDFRNLHGQYSTTYSPAIMEILIKAGYEEDHPYNKRI